MATEMSQGIYLGILLLIIPCRSQTSSTSEPLNIRTVTECLYTRYGTAYIGNISITRSGKTCQRWDQQTPHAHAYTSADEYPDESLAEANNFCRNPRGARAGGVWCYTTVSDQIWEYCDVPYCECKTHRTGHGYLGTKSRTYSGLECQRWDRQTPHTHHHTNPTFFPDPSISDANNYCRNPSPSWSWGTFCLTVKEETKLQHCSVPFCECKTTEAGEKYEAYENTTISGRACQAWTQQTPHEHSYTDTSMFPDTRMSAAANHCRNPDNSLPGGPWCFTTDPDTRWEYCKMPKCEYLVPEASLTTTTAAPSSTPFIPVTPSVAVIEEEAGSVIQECKFSSVGSTYRGNVAVTASGKTCQRWTSQSPHKHPDVPMSRLPDANVAAASNKCRNPNMASGGPWCYTTDNTTRTEYCDVPLCDCKASRSGYEYIGNQRKTKGGKQCQRWDTQTPHRHHYGDGTFPGGRARHAENFCRNPDNDQPEGPWCLTTDPEIRWQYCQVPFCECKQDDPGHHYAGRIAQTRSGRACQTWVFQTPHRHNYISDEMFPDASAANAKNYCRNPELQEKSGPWCYTVDTNVIWEPCDIPLCELPPVYNEVSHNASPKEVQTGSPAKPTFGCKLSDKGWEYAGGVAHTDSYLACQNWAAQTPHKHPYGDPGLYPDHNLTEAGNKCRNPGGERPQGPWCYTLDPHVEWQYCAIQNCGCKSNKDGWTYNGTLSNTITGKTCQHWDSQTPHNHSHTASSFPDRTLEDAANYCRNPDVWQPGGPWCFTTDPAVRWQYCDIPFCECKTTVAGHEYGGQMTKTVSGTPCQRWDAQKPHAHPIPDDSLFPDGDVTSASNFCRNPSPNEVNGPWCYTQDEHKKWELCDVPLCVDDGKHPFIIGPNEPVSTVLAGNTAGLQQTSHPAGRLSQNTTAALVILALLVVILITILLAIAYTQRHRVVRYFGKRQNFKPEAFENPVYGTSPSIGVVECEGVTLEVANATSTRMADHQGQVDKNTAT